MREYLTQFYDLKHKIEEQKEYDLHIGEITSGIYLDLIPDIKHKRSLDIGIVIFLFKTQKLWVI